MPAEERQVYFERHNLRFEHTFQKVLRIRAEQVFSSSSEAWQPHTQRISVPLFNPQGQVSGSLCIAASSQRGDLIEYKEL